MEKPKISIIVPCYKAEKTIHKAVDSIISQTFKDYELLLVDDGSPDNTGAICDKYAQKDSRIKVIHKPNGGVSTARQAGFDTSVGEYIIHADPDDYVEPQWLQFLVEKAHAENADITVCDYNEVTEESVKRVEIKPASDGVTCMKMLLEWKLTGQLWNKLIRRNLYIKHKISIIPGLDLREDSSIMYKLYYYANKVAYVDVPLYNYNLTNTASLAHNIMTEAHQEDLYLLESEMQAFCKEKIREKHLIDAFKKEFFITTGYLVMNGGDTYFKKNKNLLNFISLSDLKICSTYYRPAFAAALIGWFWLIPLYRGIIAIYHKLMQYEQH